MNEHFIYGEYTKKNIECILVNFEYLSDVSDGVLEGGMCVNNARMIATKKMLCSIL